MVKILEWLCDQYFVCRKPLEKVTFSSRQKWAVYVMNP